MSTSIINNINSRNNSNITQIKSSMRKLQLTLNQLTTARQQLIQAIINDADQAITYWKDQVELLRIIINDVMKEFVKAVNAQEYTLAGLTIITKKQSFLIDDANKAINDRNLRWPDTWPVKDMLYPDAPIPLPKTMDKITYPNVNNIPDYGKGPNQTTNTPYTQNELVNTGWLKTRDLSSRDKSRSRESQSST